MDKKIGVCCVYDHRNYGSMLQTLATLVKLDDLGYDYEIINYTRKLTPDLFLRSVGRIPVEIKKRVNKRKQYKALNAYPELIQSINVRKKCFDSFKEEHFTKVSKPYDSISKLRQATQNYSAVLVGSDQLWDPVGYSTGFFNLMFVPDNVPKLAYATSFGVGVMPKSKIKSAQTFLNRMDYISVRELRASEMIKELTGREVPTVVDPTLLFTGTEWYKMIPEKQVIKSGEKYIFCYLLGNNPEHRKAANALKAKTGYKIVCIPHLDEFVSADRDFGDIQLFDCGPNEFVNLIRNAEYVCTDSFHGSVFSILNHKQFVTFNRFDSGSKNSRNSRIDSLLGQLEITERRYNGEIVEQIERTIDYDAVEQKLSAMRKRSEEYLENALKTIK